MTATSLDLDALEAFVAHHAVGPVDVPALTLHALIVAARERNELCRQITRERALTELHDWDAMSNALSESEAQLALVTAQRDRAVEALKIFADVADPYEQWSDDDPIDDWDVLVGSLRRARDVCNEIREAIK